MSKQELEETSGDIAARVIRTLDHGARQLDAGTLARLYDSRRRALAFLQAHPAGQGLLVLRRHPALTGLGLATMLLMGAWLALHPSPPPHPATADTSALDIQLLTGELPPQVFADWSLITRENVEAVCLTDS
jgi:hypothetical protein